MTGGRDETSHMCDLEFDDSGVLFVWHRDLIEGVREHAGADGGILSRSVNAAMCWWQKGERCAQVYST